MPRPAHPSDPAYPVCMHRVSERARGVAQSGRTGNKQPNKQTNKQTDRQTNKHHAVGRTKTAKRTDNNKHIPTTITPAAISHPPQSPSLFQHPIHLLLHLTLHIQLHLPNNFRLELDCKGSKSPISVFLMETSEQKIDARFICSLCRSPKMFDNDTLSWMNCSPLCPSCPCAPQTGGNTSQGVSTSIQRIAG